MKLRVAFVLILSSSLLFLTPTLVKSEEEIVLTVTRKLEQKEMREALQVTRKAEREVIKEKRETFQEILKAQKEERKNKIDEMKADFKAEREEFKTKIESIKDERKKQLTEKIDNRMSTVNKNQTARMATVLGKLTEHINKLEGRIAELKTKEIDVSSVEALIATAKTTISVALSAVETQSAKDYVFEIADEKNLGQSVKYSYDTLSQDLKKVQELLVIAKEAVISAYKAVELLKK